MWCFKLLGLLNTLPNRMMLDWHYTWRQQLELLLNLQPVASSGHLDAVMEHCTKWVALQSPASPTNVLRTAHAQLLTG